MALEAKAGVFALNTTAGTQQITGIGFDPKIVIFFPTLQTADGIAAHAHCAVGAAASPTNRQHALANSEDGQTMSDATGYTINTGCIRANTWGTSSAIYEADLESLDTGAFTIDITTAPGSAYRVGYLALGGADLTNAYVGEFTSSGSTGDQVISSPGFLPDCVLFFGAWETTNNSSNNHAIFQTGWALSDTERGVFNQSARNNVTTMVCSRGQVQDECIQFLSRDGAVDSEADFVSMDALGFTVNWGVAGSEIVQYICLQGGQYATGSLTTQTGAGTFSETGVGFQGVAGLFGSFCAPANASPITTGLERSMGLATASGEQFQTGNVDEYNVGTSNADEFSDDALVYQNYDHSQTLEGSIAFSAWESDGFELDQIDPDPTVGNEMLYLIMGSDAVSAGQPTPIRTQGIPTGSGSRDRPGRWN